jgi:hypothetical protein
MKNIKTEIVAGKLVITIDPTVNLGRSASGKTSMCATSSGNVKVPVNGQDLYIGVNAYYKA